MSQTNINTNTRAGNTNVTITPEEADGAKEALAANVAAVAETIAERQLINIHLKEK